MERLTERYTATEKPDGASDVRNYIIRRNRSDDWNNNRKSHSMGDSQNSRQDKWAMRIYSIFEYMNTHIMSIKQRNKAKYPEYEYSHTQNTSITGKLIRNQAEQIRRMSAKEYLISKMGSGADGKESDLRVRGCEGTGEGDGGRHTE